MIARIVAAHVIAKKKIEEAKKNKEDKKLQRGKSVKKMKKKPIIPVFDNNFKQGF